MASLCSPGWAVPFPGRQEEISESGPWSFLACDPLLQWLRCCRHSVHQSSQGTAEKESRKQTKSDASSSSPAPENLLLEREPGALRLQIRHLPTELWAIEVCMYFQFVFMFVSLYGSKNSLEFSTSAHSILTGLGEKRRESNHLVKKNPNNVAIGLLFSPASLPINQV